MINLIRFVLGESGGQPQDTIKIKYLDGDEILSIYPSSLPEVQEWEDAGNTIEPYSKYHSQTLNEVKAEKLAMLRVSMTARLFIHYDQTEQLNIANGLYPPEVKAQFELNHASMMDEYGRVKDVINSAANTDDVDAAIDSTNWPLAGVA